MFYKSYLKYCRICKIELDSENWHLSAKKPNNCICKICIQNQSKIRYLKNFKYHSEQGKKYRIKHQEQILLYNQQYYDEHRELYLEIAKRKYQDNREQILQNQKQRYISNREQILKRDSQYYKTNAGKITAAKARNKRNRELSFILLNQIFDNSNGHHLDKSYVIFIPEEIHKLIRHQQKDEKSMKRINLIAWDYLESSAY